MNQPTIDFAQLLATLSIALLIWLLVYRVVRKTGAPAAAAFVYSIGAVTILAGITWLTIPGIFSIFSGR